MFCKTAGRTALKYVNAEVLKHDTGSMKLCDVQCPNHNRNSNSRLAQIVNPPAIHRIYWRLFKIISFVHLLSAPAHLAIATCYAFALAF